MFAKNKWQYHDKIMFYLKCQDGRDNWINVLMLNDLIINVDSSQTINNIFTIPSQQATIYNIHITHFCLDFRVTSVQISPLGIY